jgi:hypothetical protein
MVMDTLSENFFIAMSGELSDGALLLGQVGPAGVEPQLASQLLLLVANEFLQESAVLHQAAT